MKMISKATIVSLLFFASAKESPAIEGLQISIRCPDVLLSWPSTNGETYLVQYRQTLDTNSTWITLTNDMPNDPGTNWTTFTHSNQIQCGSSLQSAASLTPTRFSFALVDAVLNGQDAYPLSSPPMPPVSILTNGIRKLVPWEQVYGPVQPIMMPIPSALRQRVIASYNAGTLEIAEAPSATALTPDDLDPQDDGPGGGDPPATGFYRVVRDGLHQVALTNAMPLGGTVEIPLELGSTNPCPIGINLYVDDTALPRATFGPLSNGTMGIKWNTTFIPNGTYPIHARCDFAGSTDRLYSETNWVTISNLVSFVDFTTAFGDQMWVYAGFAIPEVDYEIKMFAGDTYIGSFIDSTTDGTVSFIWDLTDGNGNTFTDESFRGEFYAAAAGRPLPTNNPVIIQWNKQHGWSGDDFVLAWSNTQKVRRWAWNDELMRNGVVNILASPAADYPYRLSPGNTYDGTTFELTQASKTNLLSYLGDPTYRNFYFFGHGNANGIGDYNPVQGWIVWIGADELCAAMTNTISGTLTHPYRFVFLDSCWSASGNLCECFGIMKAQLTTSYLRNLGIKSRVFIGYLDSANTPGNHDQYVFNANMLGQLFAEWRDGVAINGSVARAKQNQYWPMDPSAIIYGAQNLYRFYPY